MPGVRDPERGAAPAKRWTAQWTEFDRQARTWTIPAAKMKCRERHVVYLNVLPPLHRREMYFPTSVRREVWVEIKRTVILGGVQFLIVLVRDFMDIMASRRTWPSAGTCA